MLLNSNDRSKAEFFSKDEESKLRSTNDFQFEVDAVMLLLKLNLEVENGGCFAKSSFTDNPRRLCHDLWRLDLVCDSFGSMRGAVVFSLLVCTGSRALSVQKCY